MQAGLPFARNLMPGNASENLDNPCPCSVFEPLFDEDDFEMCSSSGHMKPDIRGTHTLSSYPSMYQTELLNLVSKFDLRMINQCQKCP